MFNLIPNERQAAVTAALQTAFASTQLDNISLLHGGGSTSLTYKINVNQQIYVLRIMGLDQPINDRCTQIDCLKKAAQLNIAPHCYYANADTGVIIMTYIAPQPVTDRERFLIELAPIVRDLHRAVDFLPVHIKTFDYLSDLVQTLQLSALPGFLADYFKQMATIQQLLKPHLISRACHNDLNFQNILFDGTKIWLIDWEAAGMEDPFFDLATVCNQVCFNKAMEDIFLIHYFGQTPTPFQQDKLYLMRQVASYYYALHFFIHAVNTGKKIIDLATPDLYTWNIGYSMGTYQLATADDFLLYALVQTKASLAQINSPEFSHHVEKLSIH